MDDSSRTMTVDGQAVKDLRLAKLWRVEDLAIRAKCSVKTVENVERGASVYLFTIRKFAEALGVPAQQILRNDEWTTVVKVKLSTQYEDFDETTTLQAFVAALKELLHSHRLIGVIDVQGGSTIITLEIPHFKLPRFVEAFVAGEMNDIPVQVDDRVEHFHVLDVNASVVAKLLNGIYRVHRVGKIFEPQPVWVQPGSELYNRVKEGMAARQARDDIDAAVSES